MKKHRIYSLVLLSLYFIVISAISLVLNFRHLEMSLLYFGLPSIWLLWKNKKESKKIALGVLLYTLPISIIIDTVAHTSNAWYETTIFPVRFLGQFPLESFIWGINYNLFIVGFYEYFFDKYPTKNIAKDFSKVLLAFFGITLVIVFLIGLSPSILQIPYFYTLLIAIILLLSIFWLYKRPGIYLKASIVSLLIFLPSLAHEILSIELGNWIFEKGYHIGYISLLNYSFPFEELIWWILLPIAIIGFYEMYIDNKK